MTVTLGQVHGIIASMVAGGNRSSAFGQGLDAVTITGHGSVVHCRPTTAGFTVIKPGAGLDQDTDDFGVSLSGSPQYGGLTEDVGAVGIRTSGDQ